ncbi:Conserved_hypothetical protein [Hexamita inflata]|uniref:Uncharacterized protein n=1 Tax=Hexamita inflata TaxID=28002 RepID=A0AA86QE66_9EUKA|nr:Conserved hypothetical protein [Hexamita inflata]
MFLYTNITKYSKIQTNIFYLNTNCFSIFGLNNIQQTIQDSSINVTLEFEVQQAALICITCDVLVSGSTLVFVASGQQLSAVVMVSIKTTQFERSFIQFRFKSASASGLVNIINSSIDTFIVSGCNISGYNYIRSDNNGFVSSQISQPITINISQLQVCVNQPRLLGLKSVSINQVGSETTLCTLCEGSNVIYGICADALLFSQDVGGMLQCVYPFEYTGTQCICVLGYLLNQTVCVNVVENLTDLSRRIDNNYLLNNNSITDLQNIIYFIDQNDSDRQDFVNGQLITQKNNIQKYISSNYSKAESNLAQNTTVLDARIFGNATSLGSYLVNNISTLNNSVLSSLAASSIYLEHQIVNNYTGSDANLQRNTSTLEQRLNGNFSALTNSIINNISALNTTAQNNLKQNSSQIEKYILGNFSKTDLNLLSNTSIIEQRIIGNYSNLGNQMLNSISTLNVNINSNLIVNSSNLEKYIIDNYTIFEQKLLNNISELDQRLFRNVSFSNSQSSSNFSNLNDSLHFALTKNQSNLELNILNNFTQSNKDILRNTSDLDNMIYKNVTSLNNSIQQANISLIELSNQVNCTNKFGYKYISGSCVLSFCLIAQQSVVNGVCQCSNGFTEIRGSCVQVEQYVSITNDLVCSQQPFVFIINVSEIPIPQVITSGYIFSSALMVQNAWILIPTDVLTVPMFQSQVQYNNIRIQIESQSVDGGSILSNSNTININRVVIQSRGGIISSKKTALNILQGYSSNTVINSLLVDLNIGGQSNISLIQSIQSVANINQYQILGKYVCTGTVAMISITSNSATMVIQNINIKPESYNIGNVSSFLFSYILSSTVNIYNIIILIQKQDGGPLLANSIHSDSTYVYQFGGLATCITNTLFQINKSIFQCTQKITTQYISQSGFIVGLVLKNQNQVIISSLCLQYDIIDAVSTNMFGVIGYLQSNLSILKSSIKFSLSGYGTYIGAIGIIQNQLKTYILLNYFSTCVDINLDGAGSQAVGGFIGHYIATNCLIQNSNVINSQIITSKQSAGMIGRIFYTSLQTTDSLSVQNSQLNNILVQCTINAAGGLTGAGYYAIVKISNTLICNLKVDSPENVGFILAFDYGGTTFYFSQSKSKGSNYVRDELQDQQCAELNSQTSVNGCQ